MRRQRGGRTIENGDESAFDRGGHILETQCRARFGQNLERIERVIVARGVDPGCGNIEGQFFEVAGNACKQARLVAGHDHDGKSFLIAIIAVTESAHPYHRV